MASCIAAAAIAAGSGCGGSSDDSDAGSGNPASQLSVEEAKAPLKGGSPELVSLRDQANEILDEGSEGYESRLSELADAGIPVVVNNWASWCGPCRGEFPEFQDAAIQHEDDVAFVGLLSGDGTDTGNTFLSELPLPYPSYLDPDFDLSTDIGTGKRLPATAFYDSSGELVYLKSGPYASADDLEADIEKYAQ